MMRRNNYQQSAVSHRQSAVSKETFDSIRNLFTNSQSCRLLRVFNLKKTFWLLLPLFMILLFAVANWCFPLPKTRLHPPVSRIVLDRNGEWLRAFLADDGMWRMPENAHIAISRQPSAISKEPSDLISPVLTESRKPKAESQFGVSPLLHQAVLTSEDRWFYYHWGINPVSIATALSDNLKAGEIVRGGSTITMQLARLMEPKARNVPNKLIEMFRALHLN